MEHSKRKVQKIFLLSAIGFFLSAVTILLLPFTMGDNEVLASVFSMIIGILFWCGMGIGIALFILAWKSVRCEEGYLAVKQREKAGYLSFFKNKRAVVIDVVMILCWILAIVGNITLMIPNIILVPVMFLALYSFYLHFLVNGRVYSYIF